MVTNVTSLTGNGLKDWLIQRITAVYFAIYVWSFIAYLCVHPAHTYEDWYNLLHMPVVQITTIIALFLISLHVWIGLWTVVTDYIKCTVMRLSMQFFIAIFLLGQFIWGFMLLWGQS